MASRTVRSCLSRILKKDGNVTLIGRGTSKPFAFALPPRTARPRGGGPWNSFSTVPIPSESSTFPRNAKTSKSPHSKLLRVCSRQNENSHFAAIEAQMLRLKWKEAMDALVEDWARRGRWDDFLELERNVRSYAGKNMIDLARGEHRSHAHEWEQSEGLRRSVTLTDHVLRSAIFPYESIVTKAVRHSLAGEVVLHHSKLEDHAGDEKKIALAQLRERIIVMSSAGKLLDVMARFDPIGDEGRDHEPGVAVGDSWSTHHTSCSDCHRSVLSGWFLLHRRLREATKQMVAESKASEILGVATKLDIHPERETYAWAKKWIEFCTTGQVLDSKATEGGQSKGGYVVRGGILPTDEPLLLGVAKVLSMSESPKQQEQAVELDQLLGKLSFPTS